MNHFSMVPAENLHRQADEEDEEDAGEEEAFFAGEEEVTFEPVFHGRRTPRQR